MPKAARVPAPVAPRFDQAEAHLEGLFSGLTRDPARGTLHVGDERNVLMRAESFALAWSEALEVHGREGRWQACGDGPREFVMPPAAHPDAAAQRVRS